MSDQRTTPQDDSLHAALDEAAHLRTALATSREIGAAIGILMERHGLTYDNAWQTLRAASQNSNTPVRALASELVRTGELETRARPGNSSGAEPPPADVP